MISSISTCCFQHQIEVKKRIAITAIECLAFSSIAAVLISLYGLTTCGYIGIGVSSGLALLDLSLFGLVSCHSLPSSHRDHLPFRSVPYLSFTPPEVEDAAWEEGTALYDEYRYEQIPLNIDGKEVHVYYNSLSAFVQDWFQNYSCNIEFEEYMQLQIERNPKLKKALLDRNVRYFNDVERSQTKISWIEGRPYQIGLDSESIELKKMTQGEYAFVFGKNELYMAVKKRPTIVHSSFLSGCPAKCAGFITIDENGMVVKVVFFSGHYRPNNKEAQAFYKHLATILTKEQLSKIAFYYKERWDTPEIPLNLPKDLHHSFI